MWSEPTLWWTAAGVAVAVELATGTFYLLMIALGLAGGAVAAHLGLGVPAQLVLAALVGGGAVALWHVRRARQPLGPPASSNPDVNLDIGQRVHVTLWEPDGTARIQYRGAPWHARYGGSDAPAPGEHFIRAIDGSELILHR
jgi:membrane protein implicated in regulation of membrane protease activity